MSTDARLKAANEIIADQNRALAQVHASQPLTPMDMLNRAVANGADIDILEKLMGLQERWETSQARKAFDSAIAEAKVEIKPVVRTGTGHNNKKYANFADIARAVDPILGKYGLSYRFRSKQTDKIEVTCVLSHRDGHSEETTLCGPPDKTGSKNDIQAIGSTLTYLQRYSLVQALGLAAADDDDGRSAGNGAIINDDQYNEISRLITETRSDLERFLKWVGAPSIADIPASKYNDCVNLLNAKQRKASQ